MTIVTITKLPNGKSNVYEFETTVKAAFDKIVELVFHSRTTEAAYLVGDDGRMLDSYIK